MKKRYFLYFCLAVVLGITFMVCNPSRSTPEQNNPGSNGTSQNPPQGYLGYAESAATWLDKVALRNGDRAFWPEYIGIPAWDGPNARPLNLYSGNAGIAFFFLKLFRVTGKKQYRDLAMAAVNHLIHMARQSQRGYFWEHEQELNDGSIVDYRWEGLYNGDAGIGYVLMLLGKDFNEVLCNQYARGAADSIIDRASLDASGSFWPYQMTDIIAGNAGIILFLIELSKETGSAEYLDQARTAGNWLLAQAQEEDGTFHWPADAGSERTYPGFSHGVAGIAYTLAVLYQVTNYLPYLDAAQKGAQWLEKEALCDESGCRWYHYRPGGTQSYQTGWCHGISGTARLFLLLHRITGQDKYLEIVKNSAQWAMTVANPQLDSPKFHGLSLCCGAASVGEFFFDLYIYTGDETYLAFAQEIAQYLMKKGLPDRGGTTWTNYDFPDNTGRKWYATSLKLGAAGIGWFLLRLAGHELGLEDWPKIPDERL